MNIEGNVATAAQCLAGVDLVRWMITRLSDVATADRVIASVAHLPLPKG
jgi:transcriptional regulator GlxA family with amidase domain